jgi:hypothetical protein
MIGCYYRELEGAECDWTGEEADFVDHLLETHEVLSYAACFHNKLVLELLLDLESAGFRYVVLCFTQGDSKISTVFEEHFDEASKLLKLVLRGVNAEGKMYMLKVEGKNTSLEYTGEVLGIRKEAEPVQQCLQVYCKQAEKLGYIEEGELRYRISICLL